PCPRSLRLFACHRGTRYLPPLPTRRSSDLLVNFVIALVSGILLVFATLVLLYKRLMSPLVNMGSLALAPLGGIFLIWITGGSLSDRKSTRLNSSHVKISYAVFCSKIKRLNI